MYINKQEQRLLVDLFEKLMSLETLDDSLEEMALCLGQLNWKLAKQRSQGNKKSWKNIKAKRQDNPNYGRPKREWVEGVRE